MRLMWIVVINSRVEVLLVRVLIWLGLDGKLCCLLFLGVVVQNGGDKWEDGCEEG